MALRETLEQVRSDIADGHANGANEQEAKDWFITPILQALGWRGPGRVRLEHPAGRERVKMDFALQGPDRKIVAFIEAKVPGADLSSHVGQVMGYAFFEGVDLCVLTTGVEWWLYLPREKGQPMDRRFAALDLQNDDTDQLALLLESCLEYGALTSGEAERHAKDILAARQNEKRLIAELPSAWRRLFDGPDDLLVELVQDEVRKGIGLAPSKQQVAEFLREKMPGVATTSTPPQTSSPSRRDRNRERTGRGREIPGESYRCSKCGETKPKGEFYWRSNGQRLSACIACEKERHQKYKAARQGQNAERDAEIVRLRNDGVTYREISEIFNLSHVRVRKIYLRETAGRTQQAPPRSQPSNGHFSRSPSRHSKAPRRRVVGFVLLGEQHVAARWKDVWLGVAGVLYTRHTANFDHAMRLRGTSRQYIARSEEELFRARRIGTSPYFAEINFSAGDCARHSRALLELFGYRGDDLEVLEE